MTTLTQMTNDERLNL